MILSSTFGVTAVAADAGGVHVVTPRSGRTFMYLTLDMFLSAKPWHHRYAADVFPATALVDVTVYFTGLPIEPLEGADVAFHVSPRSGENRRLPIERGGWLSLSPSGGELSLPDMGVAA